MAETLITEDKQTNVTIDGVFKNNGNTVSICINNVNGSSAIVVLSVEEGKELLLKLAAELSKL